MGWVKGAISVGGTLLIGILSGISSRVGQWYRQLDKPSWTPPDAVFGPVWTVLYILMGVSFWLLWEKQAPWYVLGLFGLQLALNFLWSPTFFRWHAIGWALAIIIVLDITVIALIALAFKSSSTAALLLIPYLLWILYATALNTSIFLRN